MAEPPEQPPESHSEESHMGDVDRSEWGPTEPDEMSTLDRFFPYDPAAGTYSYHVGDED